MTLKFSQNVLRRTLGKCHHTVRKKIRTLENGNMQKFKYLGTPRAEKKKAKKSHFPILEDLFLTFTMIKKQT